MRTARTIVPANDNAPVPTALESMLGAALAFTAALGLGRFLYTPLLPAMTADLGLSQTAAGTLATANLTGYLMGALLSLQVRTDRAGVTLGLALLTSTVATIMMAFAGSYETMLVLRFAGGIASAGVMVFATTLALDALKRLGHAALYTYSIGGAGVGIALSAAIAAAAEAYTPVGIGSWRTGWLIGGALSSTFALYALRLIGTHEPLPAPVRSDRPATSRHAPFLLLALAYALFGAGYAIATTFIVSLAAATEGLKGSALTIWFMTGTAAAISAPLWAILGERLGIGRALTFACCLEAIAIGVNAMATHPLLAIASAMVLGGTFLGITALGLTLARSLAPERPQQAAAAMTSVFGLASAVAPPVAGRVIDVSQDFSPALLAAAICLGLSAFMSSLSGWMGSAEVKDAGKGVEGGERSEAGRERLAPGSSIEPQIQEEAREEAREADVRPRALMRAETLKD